MQPSTPLNIASLQEPIFLLANELRSTYNNKKCVEIFTHIVASQQMNMKTFSKLSPSLKNRLVHLRGIYIDSKQQKEIQHMFRISLDLISPAPVEPPKQESKEKKRLAEGITPDDIEPIDVYSRGPSYNDDAALARQLQESDHDQAQILSDEALARNLQKQLNVAEAERQHEVPKYKPDPYLSYLSGSAYSKYLFYGF